MNKLITFISLLILQSSNAETNSSLTSMHDMGASRTNSSDTRDVYLIDIGRKKTVKAERDSHGELKLLPERLYMRYDTELRRNVYDISTSEGKFASPSRSLLPLSDLPGSWVGANANVAFVFEGPPKKGWNLWREIPMQSARKRYMFWNLTDPPRESVHGHSAPADLEE